MTHLLAALGGTALGLGLTTVFAIRQALRVDRAARKAVPLLPPVVWIVEAGGRTTGVFSTAGKAASAVRDHEGPAQAGYAAWTVDGPAQPGPLSVPHEVERLAAPVVSHRPPMWHELLGRRDAE